MGPCFEFCYLLKQKKKLGKLEQYLVALGFQMWPNLLLGDQAGLFSFLR